MSLTLYNSLTRQKETFAPLDAQNVRLYACGPTVYDRAHIGNARATVVYDVLFRLLRELYPRVTYVRNITDVDDKINAAAIANGETIQSLTQRVTGWYHDDMAALNCLPPTHEPRATQYIPHMIALIERLLANGSAYESQAHILFNTTRAPHYGCLSGRKQEDQKAGARIEVESYKRNPGDFVLWKPTPATDDPSSIFDSPWGRGRPGWHIECSAMSIDLLGETFDLHGGGADLKFPHHENEIAQSTCAYPGSQFAKTWVHNGFVTVGGEKMSKSLGNFTTVRELLDQGIQGEVIRYVFLSTHYSKPLDWTPKAVEDAKKALDGFYRILAAHPSPIDMTLPDGLIAPLLDDMNLPQTLAMCHQSGHVALPLLRFLGLLQQTPEQWFGQTDIPAEITALADARMAAKANKNWPEADRLRAEITTLGYQMDEHKDGTYNLRKL